MTEENQEVQETHPTIYAKMVSAMRSIETLPKNGRNTYSNYNYVTDEDVMNAMRHALSNAGIALLVNVDSVGKEDNKTFVWLDISFVDGETGEKATIKWYGESLSKTQDKSPAIAITGAVKYCLLKTFLVSTGDETADGDSDSGPEQKKQHVANAASGKQRGAIAAMLKKLAAPKKVDVNHTLKARGYPILSELTKTQASELFERLETAINEKENPPPKEVEQEELPEEPPEEDPF